MRRDFVSALVLGEMVGWGADWNSWIAIMGLQV